VLRVLRLPVTVVPALAALLATLSICHLNGIVPEVVTEIDWVVARTINTNYPLDVNVTLPPAQRLLIRLGYGLLRVLRLP
jgi:hypothetical protein